eukprot:sb/3472196/
MDENNRWIVEGCLQQKEDQGMVTMVTVGDMIQLRHETTDRYLTVMNNAEGISNSVDYRVVTTEEPSIDSCFQLSHPLLTHRRIPILQSDIQLVSVSNRCALKMNDEQLPEYAAKQMERPLIKINNQLHPGVLFKILCKKGYGFHPDSEPLSTRGGEQSGGSASRILLKAS